MAQPVKKAILTLLHLLLGDWNVYEIHRLYSLWTRPFTQFEFSSSPSHYSVGGISVRKIRFPSKTPSLQSSIRHEARRWYIAGQEVSRSCCHQAEWPRDRATGSGLGARLAGQWACGGHSATPGTPFSASAQDFQEQLLVPLTLSTMNYTSPRLLNM